MITQYVIIAIIFLSAVYFLVKKFWPSKNKITGGCGKGCGCDFTKENSTI